MSIALLALAVLVPSLAMLAGHWFPWRKVLRRPLHRVEGYIYGVGWILLIPLAALTYAGLWDHAALLAGAAGGAGAATLLAYAVDRWTEAEHKVMDAQDKETLYAEIRCIHQDAASD